MAARPSAPELVRRICQEFGALPGNGWGMTETTATVTAHVGEDYLNRPDSAGPPVPVADLRIMSPDGARELPVGEVGELWAKGPQIVKGYWNKPEATAETFVDGWVRTGDLARLDEEGFLLHRRPGQGHGHPRRREHLFDRGRERPLRPSRGRPTPP